MITNKVPKILLLLFILTSIACSKTEENVPLTKPTAQIDVDKLVRKASLINQEIPFKIVTEEGEDVTDIATFYVNNIAIDTTFFTSPTIGEFEVYGVYEKDGVEITTNTEPFSVIIPKRKIVVEDYTGTWCGFCPRVAGAITTLHEATEYISVIAIHEEANSIDDPLHFEQVNVLKSAFDVVGFPAARINRTADWPNPHAISDITSIAGLDTNLALAINSELVNNELTVQVNVVYEDGSALGDKLVVYLLEDGILADQYNYYDGDTTSPFYNLGNPIVDFEHNEGLRASLSALLGDEIEATPALTEFIWSDTITIPSNYVTENLSIVAMVVDANNTAKNSQHAHVNEDKPYE